MKARAFIFVVAALVAGGSAAAQEGGDGAFVITKVDVDGNDYFKDDRVKDMLRLEKGELYERYFFDYMLEQGIAAVERAYQAEGFADVRVRWGFRDVKDGERKLQIRIEEGARAEITDILLEGVSREHYLAVRENLGVEVGSPLSAQLLNEAALKIGQYYSDHGYARASATLLIDRETGVVTFEVEEGGVYHVGDIVVAGNEKTRPRIIIREIEYKIKPDRLWRGSKIDESRAKIYRTGLYRDLRVEAVDAASEPDIIDLLVIVREDKFKYYKFEPGYESPDRASFTVGWGHNNLLGNNQRLSVETSAAYGFTTEESDFGGAATYTEPWLFGYRYVGTATLSYERKLDYDAERNFGIRQWEAAIEPRVTREITDELEVTGGLKMKRFRTEIATGKDDRTVVWPIAGSGPFERFSGTRGLQNITSIVFSSTYSTRDDLFNPLRGIYLFGSEETAGGILAGMDLWRVIADVRQYVPVGRAATAAAHVRGGFADAYGDTKDVPYVEKFFSGGAYSVRGYGQDEVGPKVTFEGKDYPAGGNVFLTVNAELRFQLPFTAGRKVPGVGLHLGNLWPGVFLDGGNVWSDWEETRKRDLVYGAGFGLRYNTPVGPIRFDYGQPVLEEGTGEAPGHFYLAFGHAF
jgi:outer membrane protein assembly complex protein YaeT